MNGTFNRFFGGSGKVISTVPLPALESVELPILFLADTFAYTVDPQLCEKGAANRLVTFMVQLVA